MSFPFSLYPIDEVSHDILPSMFMDSVIPSCGEPFCGHKHCMFRRLAYDAYIERLYSSQPCDDESCENSNCLEVRDFRRSQREERKLQNIKDADKLYYRRQHRIQQLRAKRLLKREGLAMLRLSALFAFSDDF